MGYYGAYTYSNDGLRLRVQESNHQYPDRWMQYDGVRPVLEGTLSGDTFTTLNRYVLEGNSHYDPLISASIGGQNRFYLYDGLGSTRQLLDASQTVTDTYTYEAFGNLMGSTGFTPNPYKYIGSLGYYQTGSSLQHLGARYYMLEVGRFLQRDPAIRYWPNREGVDPYAYCSDNPVRRVDPTGRVEIGWLCQALCRLIPPCPLCEWWNVACKKFCDSMCKSLCTSVEHPKCPNPRWRQCVDKSSSYEDCEECCEQGGGGAMCGAACKDRFPWPER
jgi:RHS repeat-associated protein